MDWITGIVRLGCVHWFQFVVRSQLKTTNSTNFIYSLFFMQCKKEKHSSSENSANRLLFYRNHLFHFFQVSNWGRECASICWKCILNSEWSIRVCIRLQCRCVLACQIGRISVDICQYTNEKTYTHWVDSSIFGRFWIFKVLLENRIKSIWERINHSPCLFSPNVEFVQFS